MNESELSFSLPSPGASQRVASAVACFFFVVFFLQGPFPVPSFLLIENPFISYGHPVTSFRQLNRRDHAARDDGARALLIFSGKSTVGARLAKKLAIMAKKAQIFHGIFSQKNCPIQYVECLFLTRTNTVFLLP